MPKAANNVTIVSDIAGKRGRKAEFNPKDWVMDCGEENAFDVTEEMNSALDHFNKENKTKLTTASLFDKDNETAKTYRNNRFGAFKRAAIQANGKSTKYKLSIAKDSAENLVWLMIRTDDPTANDSSENTENDS